MLIHKVCELCQVTKKAVEYYEANGLLHPEILENGYRNYSDTDIHTLKEISVLRQCGVSVSGIKHILGSENKSAALQKYRYATVLSIKKLQGVQQCMDHFLCGYDIEKAFAYLQSHHNAFFSRKEKLLFAFPGNYGIFLCLHFGRFLDGQIDTEEMGRAYNNIIHYLDSLDWDTCPELAHYLEQVFTFGNGADLEYLETTAGNAMLELLEDSGAYIARNKPEIEAYLAFLQSEDYLNSPVAAMQQKLREFLNQSGYYEKLVRSMCVLSPAYADYYQSLQAADKLFLQEIPHARKLYRLD